MSTCQSCGNLSPDGFRFCPSCGAALAEPAPSRQARKIVTALFCDVTGSTALGEQLDPEVLRGVMNRYFAEMRAIIQRHGGTVEKFIGDAVMAVFGIPRVQEDDALRAVRAAVEIRDRLPLVAAEVGVALRFRTGVNTGPVLAGEGENMAIGDAVNVAARLEQAAAPGEIVLGPDTLRLVRDAVEVEALEPLELKGKSEPIQAFRVLSLDPAAPGVARHLDAPLIARERELEILTDAWDRTVRERGCHLFTLLGMAGVGKSRLVAELLSQVGSSATILRGRCLHYGEAITFWPLAEALIEAGAPAAELHQRLESGSAASPEELFWETRRLLESLAAQLPLILHIDDLQWAEPMMFDLLDHVVDLSRGAPILLLCTARPELLDGRPTWAGGKLNATTVLLEPLGREHSQQLLDQLGDGLDPDTRQRVIAASQGNPLFLEEMMALAREHGTVTVPASIQALLAARLEQLDGDERELLERGAIEGEVFHRLAVRALAGEQLAIELEGRLGRLVRKELIRPHPATLPGDEAFRFRHLLIRDAAYDGLPKATRAELHERFANWLVDETAGLVELDEIAGWHFEQAIRYRTELGQPPDDGLAERAAEHLYAGGVRAYRRSDVAAARSLLQRARTLAPAGAVLRARAAAELAALHADAGDPSLAEEPLADAESHPETVLSAAMTRISLDMMRQPQGAAQRMDAQLPPLLERLTEASDLRGLVRCHLLIGHRHWLASQAEPTAEHARLAAEFAIQADDHGLWAQAIVRYTVALALGQSTAEHLASELDVIERRPAGPVILADIEGMRAELDLWSGDFDSARCRARAAFEAFRDLGMREPQGGSLQIAASIELDAGDVAAALVCTQQCDALINEWRSVRSTTQAEIARMQAILGNLPEARIAMENAEAWSAAEDLINFVMTHGVRARLALADGDGEAAERWSRSGVEIAFRTDFYRSRTEALMDLAEVLVALDRPDDAVPELRRAREIFARKGHRPRVADTEARLAGLGAEV